MTRGEFAQEMCKAPAIFYYGVLWNKLYRRSIVEAEGLRCPEELSWCEDFLFNLEYLRHIRLAAAVPKPIYYYIKREDSLVMTRATLRNTIEMKRTTFACYKRLYQALDLYEKQKVQIYGYLVSGATDGVSLPELPKSLRSILPERTPRRSGPIRRNAPGSVREAHSEETYRKAYGEASPEAGDLSPPDALEIGYWRRAQNAPRMAVPSGAHLVLKGIPAVAEALEGGLIKGRDGPDHVADIGGSGSLYSGVHGQLGQADIQHGRGDRVPLEIPQGGAAGLVGPVGKALGGYACAAADLLKEGGAHGVGGIFLAGVDLEDHAAVEDRGILGIGFFLYDWGGGRGRCPPRG